jgi:hypothetical protein
MPVWSLLNQPRPGPAASSVSSSTSPSQSSSRLLHCSIDFAPMTQVCGAPPTQLFTVRWQMPVPQVVVWRPKRPRATRPGSSGMSSVMPLQSLSFESQVSCTAGFGVQRLRMPAVHWGMVLRHSPTPQLTVFPLMQPSSRVRAKDTSCLSFVKGSAEKVLVAMSRIWRRNPSPFA